MSRVAAPLQVLIVEDEALLAMDIEAMVEDAGHRVIGEAACLDEVEALPVSLAPQIAFVDLHLANGSSGLDVSRVIQERWRDTLIVYVTANPAKLPADFAGGHGVIAKPFSRGGLLSAIRYLEEGVLEPPPTSPKPASFTPAPVLAEKWA